MSKLGDNIRRAIRLEAGPIGFGVAATGPRSPSMLLMVQGPAAVMHPPSDLTSRGIDAILLSLASPQAEAAHLARWVKEAGPLPCGGQVMAASAKALAALKEAGADFLAFDAEASSADALLDQEMGYVLALSGEPSDSFLRAVEPFSLDALWLYDWQGPLTVRRQMELRRLYLLSRTPLLVPVPPDIRPVELECLRDAGVVGVAVNGADAATWQRLGDLRQAIDGLPPRVRRREERPEVVLPLGRELAPQLEEEEEEEEFPPP